MESVLSVEDKTVQWQGHQCSKRSHLVGFEPLDCQWRLSHLANSDLCRFAVKSCCAYVMIFDGIAQLIPTVPRVEEPTGPAQNRVKGEYLVKQLTCVVNNKKCG